MSEGEINNYPAAPVDRNLLNTLQFYGLPVLPSPVRDPHAAR